MQISKKLLKFLTENKIKYKLVEHRTVYTALDKANTLKVPAKTIGKALVIRLGKDYALVLLGGDKILDVSKFRKQVSKWARERGEKPPGVIEFVKESWMKKNLKGTKVGAIPPFGQIWKMPTFVDKSLMREKEIVVNAGEYKISLKILPAGFKKLEDIVIADFSKKKLVKKPKKKSKKK